MLDPYKLDVFCALPRAPSPTLRPTKRSKRPTHRRNRGCHPQLKSCHPRPRRCHPPFRLTHPRLRATHLRFPRCLPPKKSCHPRLRRCHRRLRACHPRFRTTLPPLRRCHPHQKPSHPPLPRCRPSRRRCYRRLRASHPLLPTRLHHPLVRHPFPPPFVVRPSSPHPRSQVALGNAPIREVALRLPPSPLVPKLHLGMPPSAKLHFAFHSDLVPKLHLGMPRPRSCTSPSTPTSFPSCTWERPSAKLHFRIPARMRSRYRARQSDATSHHLDHCRMAARLHHRSAVQCDRRGARVLPRAQGSPDHRVGNPRQSSARHRRCARSAADDGRFQAPHRAPTHRTTRSRAV